MSVAMTAEGEGNVGAAIGLVCIAGAASAVGASIVFFPAIVKLASRRVLAASLGLSSGVMLYISFVEILPKSMVGFEVHGMNKDMAYVYATLSFFGGILTMKILDSLTRCLTRKPAPIRRDQDDDIEVAWNDDEGSCGENHSQQGQEEFPASHYCVGCSNDPAGDLKQWHELAELELESMQQGSHAPPINMVTVGRKPSMVTYPGDDDSGDISQGKKEESQGSKTQDCSSSKGTIKVQVENIPRTPGDDGIYCPPAPRLNPKEEKRKLVKMGFTSAIAIMLHNFPEGLATFVAALDDPSVGTVLAISIGIHNIPEGMCVSLPIYYATGSRWKAFAWGCIAGITEPIAALLGWLVLANMMSATAYSILYGSVSGMMVIISLKEMIPTAHRYDPEDTVVTYSILVGMVIIALSLVLFRL